MQFHTLDGAADSLFTLCLNNLQNGAANCSKHVVPYHVVLTGHTKYRKSKYSHGLASADGRRRPYSLSYGAIFYFVFCVKCVFFVGFVEINDRVGNTVDVCIVFMSRGSMETGLPYQSAYVHQCRHGVY